MAGVRSGGAVVGRAVPLAAPGGARRASASSLRESAPEPSGSQRSKHALTSCLLAWTPSTGMALRNSSRETSPSPSSSHILNISTTCAPCCRSAREICSSTGTCTGTPSLYSTCMSRPSHGRALRRRTTPFLRPSLSILRSSYRTCARLSRGATSLVCISSGGSSIACPRRSTSWICLSPMQPDPSMSKRSKSSSRASGPAGRFSSGCTARRNSRFEMAPSPSRSHD